MWEHRLSSCSGCGILIPWPGIEPSPPELQGRFLTTGPPGKSWEKALLKVAKADSQLFRVLCVRNGECDKGGHFISDLPVTRPGGSIQQGSNSFESRIPQLTLCFLLVTSIKHLRCDAWQALDGERRELNQCPFGSSKHIWFACLWIFIGFVFNTVLQNALPVPFASTVFSERTPESFLTASSRWVIHSFFHSKKCLLFTCQLQELWASRLWLFASLLVLLTSVFSATRVTKQHTLLGWNLLYFGITAYTEVWF